MPRCALRVSPCSSIESRPSPGQDWLPRLEAALRDCRAVTVLCGPSGFGAWQAREVQLAFDRRSREPEFPIVPVLLRGSDPPLGFLALETWIDLREPSREAPALRDLAQALRNERPAAGARATHAGLCPFRGLLAFREEDAALFAGRERESDALQAKVNAEPFVLVFGPSGTGKSSIVQAGWCRGSAAIRRIAGR